MYLRSRRAGPVGRTILTALLCVAVLRVPSFLHFAIVVFAVFVGGFAPYAVAVLLIFRALWTFSPFMFIYLSRLTGAATFLLYAWLGSRMRRAGRGDKAILLGLFPVYLLAEIGTTFGGLLLFGWPTLHRWAAALAESQLATGGTLNRPAAAASWLFLLVMQLVVGFLVASVLVLLIVPYFAYGSLVRKMLKRLRHAGIDL